MSGVFAGDGSINVTVVNGSAYTGLYAADGSINVVESLGTLYVGSIHPCGALWVTPATGNVLSIRAADGSLNVTTTPYFLNAQKVTTVSGSFGTIYPPTLSWASTSADTTPDFDVDLPSGNGAPFDVDTGDVLIVQYSTNGGVSWIEYVSNTLDAGEIAGAPISETGVTPLTGGSYLFRARLERGAILGAWSAEVSVEVAPQITSTNSANNAENSVLAKSLAADEPVTWSLVGGADQARFEISGSTLRWNSNGTKNYEAPDDSDTNNTYIVTVRATSVATSETTDQTITITVTDVAESHQYIAGGFTPVYINDDRTRSFIGYDIYIIES